MLSLRRMVAVAALYWHWIQLGNRPDLMRQMRQMHGQTGFAAVYPNLVIIRDDRCMVRSQPFDRAVVVADLFRASAGIVATAMVAPLILSAYYLGPLLPYYPTAPLVLCASSPSGQLAC
jgi:hypothetical protein